MLSEVKNKIPPCPAHEACKSCGQATEHSAQGVLLSFNGTRHCKYVLMALGFNATAVIQKIRLGYYQALLFLPDGVLERTHKLLHGSFNACELGGL